MTYLKQISAEMRQQPLICTITLAGTAMAIFLVMVVVMMQEIKVAPIAPESNRDRFLHAAFFCRERIDGQNSGSSTMSYHIGQRLYGSLETADTTTFYTHDIENKLVSVHGQPPHDIDIRFVDDSYWRVFDFTFICGTAFTGEDMRANFRKAILSQSVARELFGTADAVGMDFLIDNYTYYTVAGVVKDVSTTTSSAYAQIWLPLPESIIDNPDHYMGDIHATILARDKADFQAIRDEINRRVDVLNSELKTDGFRMADLGAPYSQEAVPYMCFSNVPPDYETPRKQRWAIYAILLIIPAINLSSMTQSRLRRRISEMGVRRAFGCTRARLIGNILTENMIITLAGGLLGFLLSVAFTWMASDWLFANPNIVNADSGITPLMLLNSEVFLFALAACFVLNLLSSILPAWRASRLNPVEAINGTHR